MSAEDADSSPQRKAPPLSPSDATPKRFRPVKRPPVGLLQVFDDGADSAEVFRLRQDKTIIGRTQCDVNIPHDAEIAPQHCIIKRVRTESRYAWLIEALSDAAVYVRVRRARLNDGSEFLVGMQHVAFRHPQAKSPTAQTGFEAKLNRGSFPGLSLDDEPLSCPSLEVTGASGTSNKVWLLADEYWIGRESECNICVPEDVFLAGKHVQLAREKSSSGSKHSGSTHTWEARSHGVRNGMWLRMPSISVKSSCTFQIGEQRLRLIVPT
ncbi:MAG: FHA domain-containing protein [Pirellulales bacterium]